MKIQQVVKELEEAARQLGLNVRREKGGFRGGMCQRNGEDLLMLNRNHPPEIHLAVLADVLRTHPVDTVYLRPAVRHALEDAWTRSVRIDIQEDDGN